MGSGTDGELHISTELGRQPVRPVHQLERRRVGRELQQARQRLERQRSGAPSQVYSFSPVRESFIYTTSSTHLSSYQLRTMDLIKRLVYSYQWLLSPTRV